jgi:hypothetical protein
MRLYLISSGSCVTLSSVPAASNYGRLFDPDDIYVYATSGKLLASRDGGSSFINIIPDGMSFVNTICRTLSGQDSMTQITGTLSGVMASQYQVWPEITTWTSGSALPTGFQPSDAAGDLYGNIGILLGNAHSGLESRILASRSGAPFGFVDSDAGVPQSSGSIALITDIDICE